MLKISNVLYEGHYCSYNLQIISSLLQLQLNYTSFCMHKLRNELNISRRAVIEQESNVLKCDLKTFFAQFSESSYGYQNIISSLAHYTVH